MSRGGAPNLNLIQRKGKLTKADRSTVVSDLTGRGLTVGGDAAEEDPQPSAGSIQAPVAAPAEQPQPEAAPVPVQPAPAAVPPAPAGTPAQAAAPAPAAAVPVAAEVPAQAPAKKAKDTGVKVGFYQPREEGDAMRAAFIATRHITKHRTLSDFICSIVAAEVARLEKEYNDGEPFETEPNGVPRGRPIG